MKKLLLLLILILGIALAGCQPPYFGTNDIALNDLIESIKKDIEKEMEKNKDNKYHQIDKANLNGIDYYADEYVSPRGVGYLIYYKYEKDNCLMKRIDVIGPEQDRVVEEYCAKDLTPSSTPEL